MANTARVALETALRVRKLDRTLTAALLVDVQEDEVVRRLSGEKTETSAVFNMATPFGGGKTHSMLALYHLFSGIAPTELAGMDAVFRSNLGQGLLLFKQFLDDLGLKSR